MSLSKPQLRSNSYFALRNNLLISPSPLHKGDGEGKRET